MKAGMKFWKKMQQFCSDIGNPRVNVSDGAKEFTSSDFRSFCRKRGVRHETSVLIPRSRMGKLKECGEQWLE